MSGWWERFGRWVLGLIWATVGAVFPTVVVAIDSWARYSDPVDWTLLKRVAISGALTGAAGYYRSHRVYLDGLFTPAPEDDTTK